MSHLESCYLDALLELKRRAFNVVFDEQLKGLKSFQEHRVITLYSLDKLHLLLEMRFSLKLPL